MQAFFLYEDETLFTFTQLFFDLFDPLKIDKMLLVFKRATKIHIVLLLLIFWKLAPF